jgi:hypothetical protein
MVDGIRALLVTGDLSQFPFDLMILGTVTLLISILSAYMYPKVAA